MARALSPASVLRSPASRVALALLFAFALVASPTASPTPVAQAASRVITVTTDADYDPSLVINNDNDITLREAILIATYGTGQGCVGHTLTPAEFAACCSTYPGGSPPGSGSADTIVFSPTFGGDFNIQVDCLLPQMALSTANDTIDGSSSSQKVSLMPLATACL